MSSDEEMVEVSRCWKAYKGSNVTKGVAGKRETRVLAR